MTRIIPVLAVLAAFAGVGLRPALAADAEQLFKFYCAQCHGLAGKGDGPNVSPDFPVTPRNFTKPEEMNKLTKAEIKNVITEGGPSVSKSPMMPPWGKTLTSEEIDALIGHLFKLCACQGKPG